ncbi:retrovirus-related pol polyprotein from transposon TNT 1-94 [Tanacetum coccineum]
MFEKAKDPEVIAKKISHKPIDYEKLNSLIEDFETRFSPQQELSAEQTFWFHTFNPTIKPSYSPPVIVDVPSELPKEIVKQAKAKQPLDGDLDLACKYATRIQELLVYVQDTYLNAITPSTKKVLSLPIEQCQDKSEVLLLSNCGSKPQAIKRRIGISQTPSRNKKNKVEAQPRKVNKMNHVVKPVCDVDVKQSLSNANSDILSRTPQQNGVDERRNRTFVEAARTMLIFSKALLFLWAKAINTACYTQNCSLIPLRYNKTPYELMQDKKPDLSFFHVFGSVCYPINDHEDLGKFNAKADIGIFVGYVPAKKAFRIYNRRNRIITETIHVTFDKLISMASEQFSSGPRL